MNYFLVLGLCLGELSTKLRGSFSGGGFHQGVQVPIGVPRGGVWGRVQVGGGGWFSSGKEEKGKGVGRVGGG